MELLHQLRWLLSSEGILHVINVWGLPGICAILFAETAIFPILPGDSLLVLAGFAAGTVVLGGEPTLSITGLLIFAPICAIVGDQVGYGVGRLVGKAVYGWPERRLGPLPLFKPEWISVTEDFYKRWGSFTIVACRWVPIVRTIAPILAGVGRMPWRKFFPYNIVGGATWVWSMVGLGFALVRGLQAAIERFIPGFRMEQHIDKIMLLVIAASVVPLLFVFKKDPAAKRSAPGAAAKPKKKAQAKAKAKAKPKAKRR